MIILKVLSQKAMQLPDTIVTLLWSNTGCGYRCIQLGQNRLDVTIMEDVVSTGLNHGCGLIIWCMSTFSFVSIDTKFPIGILLQTFFVVYTPLWDVLANLNLFFIAISAIITLPSNSYSLPPILLK